MAFWWPDRNLEPIHYGGRVDRWTGKSTERPPVIPGESCGEQCETHAAELINDCAWCGAPACCPVCCKEARDEPGGGS